MKYAILEKKVSGAEPLYRYGCVYYNSLTRREQILYDAVADAARGCRKYTSLLPYNFTDGEFDNVMTLVTAENPELFYIIKDKSELYSSSRKSRVKLAYYGGKKDIGKMKASLENAVSKGAAIAAGAADEFETEAAIHDYLLDSVSLIQEDPDIFGVESPMSDTAYGALVYGRAESDGYAAAFKLLLNKCGIYCSTVFGKAVMSGSSYDHVWSLVYIDGEFYHTDTAWDDADLSYAPGISFHGYFNLSSAAISKDHIITKLQSLPRSVSENSYYMRRGLYVEGSYELGGIVYNALMNAGKNGKNYIELYPAYTRDGEMLREEIIAQIKYVNSVQNDFKFREAIRFYNASETGNALTVQLYYDN